jgi:ATP sulfurylase
MIQQLVTAQSKNRVRLGHINTIRSILVNGPSILVHILIGNQQTHRNDHFIVMSSQTLLRVSAY